MAIRVETNNPVQRALSVPPPKEEASVSNSAVNPLLPRPLVPRVRSVRVQADVPTEPRASKREAAATSVWCSVPPTQIAQAEMADSASKSETMSTLVCAAKTANARAVSLATKPRSRSFFNKASERAPQQAALYLVSRVRRAKMRKRRKQRALRKAKTASVIPQERKGRVKLARKMSYAKMASNASESEPTAISVWSLAKMDNPGSANLAEAA